MPLKQRSDCVSAVRKLVRQVRATDAQSLSEKVVWSVRTDNDTVFRSKDWACMLEDLNVADAHSAPYTPQMNGCVERFMRTLGEGLRANLSGVDKRLYCYAAQYLAWTWNRVRRQKYKRAPQYEGLAPLEARRARTQSTTGAAPQCGRDVDPSWVPVMRRFGSLAYILVQPRDQLPKLQPRWRKAVFLGCSENSSSWVFGTYTEDARCAPGIRWG